MKFPANIVVKEADAKLLNAAIMSPSGLEEPCFIKKLADGNIGEKTYHVGQLLLRNYIRPANRQAMF